VSILFADVSRVLTHELVRHRAGTAFSQTSGRYVRLDEIDLFLPRVVRDRPEAVAVYMRAQKQMEDNARELAAIFEIDKQSFAVKKEMTSAIRRILGNGQSNNIIVTANHRAWRHIIEMRTGEHVEEEISFTMTEVARLLAERYPAIYADIEFSDTSVDFEHSKV
jgi:thymidylate synthase (FAD)